uniref:GH18 domain-containing protein n=1 Tax=Clastoptera arizonana TaxID=38151 RepID=A0A1B6D586_9HEMI
MNLAYVLLVATAFLVSQSQAGKVVCYWDGRSYHRQGAAKIVVDDIKQGLQYCTQLNYGYAGVDDDSYNLKHLDPELVLDSGKKQYRAVTDLRKMYPGLSVHLSVGGFGDPEDMNKYLSLLEEEGSRTKFINSVRQALTQFEFDGVDLIWRFPEPKEKKERGTLGTIWSGIKSVFKSSDEKVQEHREQFVQLLRDLKAAIKPKQLSIGVMPHVNASDYFDVHNFINSVDLVNLWTFDFRTPKRVKAQADYAHPLYYVYDRNSYQNVDAHVKWWLEQGAPANKLTLAIPTFGRSWKLTEESAKSGVPPLVADGPGDEGPYTKIKGTLAYYETCTRLVDPSSKNAPSNLLRKVVDPSNRLGQYAYRIPRDGGEEGYWISYDDPAIAKIKAQYAKQKGLAGVSVVDMSMDDPRGACDGTKFPILQSAKVNS